MADENVKDGDQENKDMVSKADLDAANAAKMELETKLEEMRMEVFSPEYLAFVNSEKNAGKEELKEVKKEIPDEKLEKMSPKEILQLAKEQAIAEMRGEIQSVKEEFTTKDKERTSKEVAAFARTHADFDTYRPVMYGISLDPKNANLSLEELYTEAKSHVQRIHTGVSEVEKERQKKLAGEKPGGSSESFEELRKLSPEQAALAAAEELGDLPI